MRVAKTVKTSVGNDGAVVISHKPGRGARAEISTLIHIPDGIKKNELLELDEKLMDQLSGLIQSWTGVIEDETGEDLECNDENKQALLREPGILHLIMKDVIVFGRLIP